VLANPICESRNDRPRDQSDSGPRRQHGADRPRPEAALIKEPGEKTETRPAVGGDGCREQTGDTEDEPWLSR
jgi:hypothetical protein